MLVDAADDLLVQPSAKKLHLAPNAEDVGSAAMNLTDLDDIAKFCEQSTVSLGTDLISCLDEIANFGETEHSESWH